MCGPILVASGQMNKQTNEQVQNKKWTNGQMDDVVGTDGPFAHLTICSKRLYNGLGAGGETCQQKNIRAEELGTKN